MSSSKPTVFVCSATGSQGGAVARQILELKWNVHATVRNMDSPAADSLGLAGVQLTKGNWEDEEALRSSISGCDKLFLCLLPNFNDLSSELRQTQSILKIAKSVGVKQVVATSSLGVSQLDTNVHFNQNSFMKTHLLNKKAIEQAIIHASFEQYTILRPAFFMANFLEPKINRYAEVRDNGTWTTCLTPSTLLPLIDHEDTARFAVAAFQDPDLFNRRVIGVASELLTVQEILDQISSSLGRVNEFQAIFLTDEEVEALAGSKQLMKEEKAMRTIADYVDMRELGRVVSLTTFKTFLEREKEALTKTFHR